MASHIGNCRILGEIGSGGMAIVYKAVQEPLGRIVALKSLKQTIAVESQFAKRFEREARFMASLQHENILHVYDFVNDGRTMYIVMEYVQGIDLYDVLDRVDRVPVEEAAIIALQVARALDYAHFRGLVHRDVKPANIMMSRDGVVKLMDFGIARDDMLSDLTDTGTGLGTPSYMSPEQILGDRLDFRSDIFSLGIVLYQMVTGRKPFLEDDIRSVMQKIRLDRYQPARRINPDVPRSMERILARCMEKMPSHRYPTTQALIDDLAEFLAPRISVNHQARLVVYQTQVGVLSQSEADEMLAVSQTRALRRGPIASSLLRRTAAVQGVLLAILVIGAVSIQVLTDGFRNMSMSSQNTSMLCMPGHLGYVRFVANPWADVYVDGKHVATTPSAQPVPLPPGSHEIEFRNPHFRSVVRKLEVDVGGSYRLDADLFAAGTSKKTASNGDSGKSAK